MTHDDVVEELDPQELAGSREVASDPDVGFTGGGIHRWDGCVR